ncbi:GH36-type glycosyl hydrolase domain-containing protein [Agrobacterium sp. rho-13.3]|uniref:GH36-type glycosyl hydrolase domain-containing protein n=1 Tax=Agrobacterium sp. rho-13.3 TaxID=3072980 RepID=UPI002A15661A|nr:glucoamylase family protein [Agrobacterium sp. rho-13.3]MDX8310689.1 glucoamylase family protein [Agrobacterium sp. rho-13.3]
MSFHITPTAAARDSEAKQIDHNDSIRSVYFTIEELRDCGAELSKSGADGLPGFMEFDFFARHRENEKEILRVYRTTAVDSENGQTITPAAEWLLDNHYVIEEAIQEVRRDFPRKFYRQLPTIKIGNSEIPRVMALAWLYVAHTHSTISRESMTALVEGYQTSKTLQIGELWALPSILRFVLIENLRRISIRVERSRRMRQKANEVVDEIIRLNDAEASAALLKQIDNLVDDPTFSTQFLYRLRNGSQTSGFAVNWLEERLHSAGTDAENIMMAEHNRLASGNVTMGNIVKSLREIDDTEWSVWFEEVSHIDKGLREHTDYQTLDFGSRNTYRNTVELLARRSSKTEIEVAQTAVDMVTETANSDQKYHHEPNVGSFLIGERRQELEDRIGYKPLFSQRVARVMRRFNWLSVAVPVTAVTALVMAIVGWFLAEAGMPWYVVTAFLLMFAVPASEGATGLFNTVVTFFVKPFRLVGYEFKEGIPQDARTLLAVPCMLTSRDAVDEMVRNLEVHYLANPHGEIYFALISDWRDAPYEQSDEDNEILEYGKREIAALGARYASEGKNRFFLLHRRRLYNPAEGSWMGWERKRGKLHELNMLLRGDKDTTFLNGANMVPDNVKYVMTLDADTRLMRDAVTKLVGKMHHPINRPVHDPETGRVIHGYGLLQPRVTPSLTTGKDASVFQRVFSINRGIDPYVFTVSDVYQDLTSEGTFTGKGLYDVDAFETALKGRIDENAVLSHDLLEGSFARCALVTDVELVEDFPTRYEVEVSRQHRWARGDWQLLPYIMDAKRGVTALGRWKMVDNLRRSLTPVAWFLASVLGWYYMGPLGALIWQILLIFSLFVSPTLSLLSGIVPRSTDIVPQAHFHTLWSEIRATNAQVALRIVFIADSACLMVDAIARSLYRLFVSGKLMLEWRTAASIQSSAQGSILDYYRQMWHAPVVALLGLLFASLPGDNAFLVGLPFALLWVFSPAVAWYVSQSAETEDRLFVSEHVSGELRKIARRTWRYYEAFVTASENYLPPDNYQETPEPVVASRTSPTNIGVYLLSVISARQFGWISFSETVERMEKTIQTVEKMDKYRGHLFNWYHTDTLQTLGPRYVSAVDSGNLAGHLIAISSACRQWAEAPSAHLQGNLDGIGDVAGILRETLKELPDDRKNLRPLHRRLEERIIGFSNALASVKREHEFASIRVINLAVLARDIQKLAANLDLEVKSEQSTEVTRWAQSLVDCCEAHISDSAFDLSTIDPLRDRLNSLRDRSRNLAFSMDFAFLYRKDRRLLSIGYRVDSKELDEACYDLLASECRLTSLFAIAKGDLPTEHWYRLGRQVVPIGAQGALVSWSGSMFEYLMPPLVMQERHGGILNQTNNLIVKEQMNHGRRLGTPWGISEAAFNARDHNMNYQYTNFGVPTLGLKRGLGQNAVIAPYASILASQYDPDAALENLQKLRKLGAIGKYGFYDAVDFTPTRVPDGKVCAVVFNYYAHHHGMSIAAVANVVLDGILRELFHADPVIEAAELLLQEKAPREVPVMSAKYEPETPGKEQADLLRAEVRTIADPAVRDREVVFLSNGHYSTMLTSTGAGYSKWNGLAISRWKSDPTEDRWGTFLFLRDTVSGDWWSATAEPRVAVGEKTKTVFSDDKAEFHKTVGDLQSVVECIVATEHDAEGRRLTLLNVGSEDRYIEVTSYMEPVIANEDDDNAHPLFSRMFVQTEIGKRGDVIRAWRNKRSPSEASTVIAHLAADNAGPARPTEFETDRAKFIGRGRSLSEAAAFDPAATLSGTDGFTLDPILSLRRVVRVPAGKKVSVIFWTIAAPSREEVDKAIDRYRHPDAFAHELVHAWTRTQVQMRHVGVTSQQAAAFQHLARYLVYPDMHLRADADTLKTGLASQRSLWPLAISGDFPIFSLRINDDMDMDIAREALSAHEYLRSRGVIFDLVIVNERAASYAQDMQHALDFISEAQRRINPADGGRPHVFSVRRDLMDEETWSALLAASRVVLHVRNGKIVDQVNRAVSLFAAHRGPDGSDLAQARLPARTFPQGEAVEDAHDLDFWNGFGGFTKTGDEYVVRLHGGQSTPQPWINVISNDKFGFHVSAEGAAFTWSRNSRDYQLTPWSNDPVSNRPGEAIYVADVESGKIHSPFAALSRNPDAIFETRHGLGYSVFRSIEDGLDIEVTQTVDREKPVKLSRLTIRNVGTQNRRLKTYGYVEWVLGNNTQKSAPFILSSHDDETGALFASNPYSIDYNARTAFLSLESPAGNFTTSKREFIGRYGSVQAPQAVVSGAALSGSVELDGAPCAAIMQEIHLKPGEERRVLFYVGDADTVEEARTLVKDIRQSDFDAVLAANKEFWNGFTGQLQVSTPDAGFNHMVNNWLPYQALACRILARTAFYQSSGAFGFRDQLQDTLAFLLYQPDLARSQILRAAGRQFPEGDVQHWWLPLTGAGVRTTISDDVVWLAYAAHQYIAATGDKAILEESIPFLKGPALTPGQHDAFFQPETSEKSVSLYEHAALALDLAIHRTGENGLPLMLGGDWNDGMNRVGVAGKGTSVWLGWFLAGTLRDFIEIAEERRDLDRVEKWRTHRDKLRAALETAGWDGDYYRRGYFDDGTPLGSITSEECRIDSLGQSWSVLSGEGEEQRSAQAMDAVMKQLVDEKTGIIRLFTPAFARSPQDPGYIKAYPPGVRENGGQYTHAATWVVLALAKLGRSEDAWKCFSLLNPVNHALDRQSSETYRVEPYVVTADVYGEGAYAGRGGWSWYTGSAGWLYRAAVEGILGITRIDGKLHISPSLPEAWDGFSAKITLEGKVREVAVKRTAGSPDIEVSLDGATLTGKDRAIPFD